MLHATVWTTWRIVTSLMCVLQRKKQRLKQRRYGSIMTYLHRLIPTPDLECNLYSCPMELEQNGMANVTKLYRGYNYVLGSFTLSERSEKQCHYQICPKDVQLGCQGNVSNALFLLPPARSCGKVMFLHLSVSHSVHGGGVLCPSMHHRSHDWGEVSVLEGGGSLSRGVLVRETPLRYRTGGTHPTGMHSCL